MNQCLSMYPALVEDAASRGWSGGELTYEAELLRTIAALAARGEDVSEAAKVWLSATPRIQGLPLTVEELYESFAMWTRAKINRTPPTQANSATKELRRAFFPEEGDLVPEEHL